MEKSTAPEVAPDQALPRRMYVVYDRMTGRIVHRHTTDVAKDDTRGEDERQQEVVELVKGDAATVRRVTRGDVANLAVLAVDSDPSSDVMVDVKSRKLARVPALRLLADKAVINGDGRDSVTIKIEVHDPTGAIDAGFSSELRLTTTHGKLSAARGLLRIKGGHGSLTLTSTSETIERVTLQARCEERPCAPATLDLEFA